MTTLVTTLLDELQKLLSQDARILKDPESKEFVEHLARWSDLEKKLPAAIVLPATEDDVAIAVKSAISHNIPFVAKSGGHSLWSTIDSSGFVLDLSLLKNIAIDPSSRQVTVQSGVLIKEVNQAAFDAGLVLPLGTANTGGVIPSVIGGGLSALHSLLGFGSDNVLRAHVVTAKGELVQVSDTENSDLLWALRGAGQHFGIVTELTLQGHPLSVLGSDDGTVWGGSMVFPAERAAEIANAIVPVLENTSAPTAGLLLLASPPPAHSTVIILMVFYMGPPSEGEKYWEPILSLQPLATDLKSIVWTKVNDGIDPWCVKGQFKRFSGTGGTKFQPQSFVSLLEQYEELKAKVPDAIGTGWGIEFSMFVDLNAVKHRESAFAHKDIKVWMELLTWYTNAEAHDEVNRIEQGALKSFREANADAGSATYQNWNRNVPVEWRYRGAERLQKLKDLKRLWDPAGVFTREFLDNV